MRGRLALAAALVAGSCGGAGAQSIEWRAGGVGGGWYTIVTGASKLLEEKNPGLTVKAVPSITARGAW